MPAAPPALLRLAAGAVVVLASVGAAPGPGDRDVAGASARGHQAEGVRDHVVLLDTAGTTAEAALAAVEQAGAEVVDHNAQLGVALVRSADPDFLATARRTRGVRAAAENHAVGAAQAGMPHRTAPARPRGAGAARPELGRKSAGSAASAQPVGEPLADRQWNLAMIGAPADQAHRTATGAGVDVGIVDTGIDPRHPDIAPNYDAARSRNFTTDHPVLDGPCEVPSCVDPPDVDGAGHGTHVAGVVAAARNGIGITGVAPDARLVSLRAGQDSGYFFLYETVDALTAAGDMGLDVVNLSFYTDPWLYNCTSRGEYLSGAVSDEELAQQQLTRQLVEAALEYAHRRGVTMVAAIGNEHTDLASPQRVDPTVPSADGRPRTRTVARSCINLPSEGPHVIGVGAVGPSGTKADYSNWGYPSVRLVAPGGWRRDRGGPTGQPGPRNLILSAYPTDAAMAEGLVDGTGRPVDDFTVRSCDTSGTSCGLYTYLQGSSMAAPHVTGVVALLIQRHGAGSPRTGYSLGPDRVAELLAATATDHPCPPGGVEDYTDEGRPSSWSAPCLGSPAVNELYGEGIVSAR